jgi:hypothetical protein
LPTNESPAVKIISLPPVVFPTVRVAARVPTPAIDIEANSFRAPIMEMALKSVVERFS